MARKKSRKVVKARKGHSVPTIFDCPFCNHNQSVECKIDRKQWIGIIHCRVCNESYQTQINYLSEPIDVYSEWIDECERVNQEADHELAFSSAPRHEEARRQAVPPMPGNIRGHVDEEDDDLLEDEGTGVADPYGRESYAMSQRTNRYRHVEDDEEEDDDEALLDYRP